VKGEAMQIDTIKMAPDQAKAKLRAYRAQLHRDIDGRYAAAAAAYKTLAKGTPLIELTPAIRSGGFDEHMRPRLAIARADRKQVRFDWEPRSTVATYSTAKDGHHHGPTMVLAIDMGRLHGQTRSGMRGPIATWIRAYAQVPMIPADVLPAKGQPRDWHILWEVDHWSDQPLVAEPSRDPLLLKHIGGDLWAVLAQWELTDLEMAILRQAHA
jgi:hypothetical protein